MPSEDGTATSGLSHALWGELENFPSKYFYWGPLRQNPDSPICLYLEVVLEVKINIIIYILDIRVRKIHSFVA